MNTSKDINKDAKKLERKRIIKKGLKLFWFSFFFLLFGIFFTLFATKQGWLGEMPDVDQLDNPDINKASVIISADGIEIDKFEDEKRIPITYKDLPPHLVDALLAKEDKRFYEHAGIDAQRILGAIYYLGQKGGGSTISQQLAKLLFTEKRAKNKIERSFQKIKEWIIAVELEKRYTKQEIITMYFNKFDYLHNAHGIEMASQIYFNKPTKQLTLDEAAIFVGMFENPRIYNPKGRPENAVKQRNLVLSLMKEQGRISEVQYYETSQKPIKLDYKRVEKAGNSSFSAYFKHQLRKDVERQLDEYEKQSGKKYNLYKDGLKIYVTIDSRMQKYAEEAIKEHIQKLQKIFFADVRGRKTAPFSGVSEAQANELFKTAMRRTDRYKTLKEKGLSEDEIVAEFKKPTRLDIFTWKGYQDTLMSPWDSIRYHKHITNCGLMAMEPMTGNIKAWVGGIDWNYFQYDHVKQARRQVGSTFKPFVYASLIVNTGYTPCSTISNSVSPRMGWVPKGSGGGSTTIKNALAKSLNGCAVNAMNIAGVNNTIALCRDLGIESPIAPYLTSALGASDITLYEMVGGYSTFANYGTYTHPEMIWRIEDSNGKVIKEYVPEQKEVLNELHAYSMIETMKGVVDGGTGKAAKTYINTDIAAKTGTTNLNSDTWFIGMTPRLACGVWVGWEDRQTHFNSALGQGSKSALPVWGIFMKKVYSNKDLGYKLDERFIPPASLEGGFDCDVLKTIGGYGESYGGIDDFEYEINEYSPKPNTKGTRTSGSSTDLNQSINRQDTLDF